MAKSATLYVILSSDAAFRRVAFPFLLFASSAFRFNLFSLLYFTAMLISLVLPGTRRSNHRIPNFILSIILFALSVIGTLGQPFFQITLATDYNDTYCSHDEKIWRQCGFIQFDVNAADVVRHLLPDIVVLVTSLLSLLLITAISLTQMEQTSLSLDKQPGSTDKHEGVHKRDSIDTDSYQSINPNLTIQDAPSKRSSKSSIPSVRKEKQLEKSQRSSFLLTPPKQTFSYVTTAWNFMVVFLLWLSGVSIASVLNFPYFVASVYLSLCWALRLNHARFFIISQRIVIMLVTMYSAVHLIVLHLYQFQSAQDLVPRPSISARVLGLVGIVRTRCDDPTKLHVHGGLEWPDYLGPISVLLLYCMTATDVRYWLFFVKKQGHLPAPEMKHKNQRSSIDLERSSSQMMTVSDEEQQSVSDSSTVKTKKKRSRWKRWFSHDGIVGWLLKLTRTAIVKGVNYFVEINFVLTLFSTMVWSLLFPSWPSFVLLMWSCVVWVTPKFNAKDVVYYSTPILVLYAIALLLIQYLYNLDLTERELESNIYAGLARYYGPPAGARVLTIALKSLFTATFMCSLREFIFLYKHRWRHYLNIGIFSLSQRDDDLDTNLIPPTSPILDGGVRGTYTYLKRYWLLATTAAFLLVSLVGDVTIFKMVYMLFFLLFLLCYEIFPRWWYTIMKPVWTILIFYAFVELVLIYTYQFSYIRHKWRDLFEDTHGHWTPEEILQSIGFFQVAIDDLSFTNVKDLFETSVPPALFVAVMALQLKYFSPRSEREETPAQYSIQVGDDGIQENDNVNEVGWNITTVFNKSKKYFGIFTEFCWRFLEIYLDKVIVIVTFILVLQQISSTHVITLFILLCPIVGLKAKHMWYPLLTLYVGTLIMLKMLYQVKMVEPHSFDLTDDCPAIDLEGNFTDGNTSPVSGDVFNYKYSPQESDPAWFGFFKVECKHCSGFPSYIKTHIAVVMLIACCYSVRRRQDRYYRQHSIDIPEAERTALFWGIGVDEMDKSIFKTVAYLISHIFDFYGLEICWCMLAINVAVRIDVYGVIYAAALGLLLAMPRRRLRPVWSVYLLVHGSLLMLQYLLVLNTPYGACIQDKREDKDLPWSDVKPLGLKRWLWLPLSSDNVVILNKHWLWADFFTFVFICTESFNLHRRLIGATVPGIFTQRFAFVSFASAEILLDHIKRVMFKHSYWITVFIILSAGVAQVSVLGVVYLFACFILLWFSGSIRLLPHRRLKCSRTHSHHARQVLWSLMNYRWFFLLMVVWSVILLKISLQIWTCVYHQNEFDNDCVVTRIFNAQCGARDYYGVSDPGTQCDDLPHHVGLWLDVFAFAAIVIQIILFSTTYWDCIRQSTISKYVAIDPDWVTAALLEKINNNLSRNRIREKKIKEQIRKRLLEVKEKYQTSVLEHYLRAGVILPKTVKFIGEDKALLHDQTLLLSKGLLDTQHTKLSPSLSVASIASEQHEEDEEFRSPGIWRILGIVADLTDNALVMAIEWLHGKSTYYYYLVERVEVQQLEESQGLQHIPASLSDDSIHLVPPAVTIEKTELPGDDTNSVTPLSDHEEGDHIVLYSKERVYQTLSRISQRPKELLQVLYHAIIANTDYICYLLIVINVMVNGSILSLLYAALMFLWGLLSIPWPTKRFWLTLIVYTMFVILLKYGFQFQQIDWSGSPDAGLYWPHVLGIEKKHNFFENVVWDILLLIFLFVHRGLLHETGRWEIPGYFSVSSFQDTDGTSALKLIFKKRSDLMESDKDVGIDSKASNVQDDDYDDNDDDDDDDDDDDEITENRFIVILIKSISLNVKYFFNQIISPDISLQAHNYYTMSFIMDTISFVIIAIGFSSFGADEDEGLTAVADYIQQNNVPIPFLLMLFAHFMSMVIDRAIYLRKSIAAKLIFLLFQLFAWHLWLLFILPASPVTDRPFTDNGFSQALYFFKSMYFILSAQQCVSGYPKRVLGYFISKQFNIVASTIFKIYRAVPLLPELKEVMDWMFTPTSLELSHWLKVQEIWALLYGIKNARRWEKSDPRMLGNPESFLAKLFIGGGLLALLILLIWGPLLIIALINTTNVSNPPVEVSIHLSISSFEPLLTMRVDEQDIRGLNDDQYDRLKNDYARNKQRRNSFEQHFKQSDFQYVLFSGRSTALWQISPPSRTALEYLLQHETSFVPLVFSWTITREPDTGLASEIVSGEAVKRLYSSDPEGNRTRQGLLNLLRAPNSNPVFISNLFPQYIYAPANGPSRDMKILSHGHGVDCQASLEVRNITVTPPGERSPVSIVEEWWRLSQNSSHRAVKDHPNDTEFIIYSEKISKPEFSFIAGLGIIGLYVSIVLVIGSALRTYVARLPSQINIDEIPDPDSLLELCDDIFYVREDRQLQEEEILVGRLFFTFRSSVRLIEETRWKQD